MSKSNFTTESDYESAYCMDSTVQNQQHDKLSQVLQQFADQDLLRVERIDKRDSSGHVTDILNEQGQILAKVSGWLVGQDFAMGWRDEYTKWTNILDDEYVEILLMIDHNPLPKLPEFAGCKNQAACNLDDFGDYKIKIKRAHVTDFFDE